MTVIHALFRDCVLLAFIHIRCATLGFECGAAGVTTARAVADGREGGARATAATAAGVLSGGGGKIAAPAAASGCRSVLSTQAATTC